MPTLTHTLTHLHMHTHSPHNAPHARTHFSQMQTCTLVFYTYSCTMIHLMHRHSHVRSHSHAKLGNSTCASHVHSHRTLTRDTLMQAHMQRTHVSTHTYTLSTHAAMHALAHILTQLANTHTQHALTYTSHMCTEEGSDTKCQTVDGLGSDLHSTAFQKHRVPRGHATTLFPSGLRRLNQHGNARGLTLSVGFLWFE